MSNLIVYLNVELKFVKSWKYALNASSNRQFGLAEAYLQVFYLQKFHTPCIFFAAVTKGIVNRGS